MTDTTTPTNPLASLLSQTLDTTRRDANAASINARRLDRAVRALMAADLVAELVTSCNDLELTTYFVDEDGDTETFLYVGGRSFDYQIVEFVDDGNDEFPSLIEWAEWDCPEAVDARRGRLRPECVRWFFDQIVGADLPEIARAAFYWEMGRRGVPGFTSPSYARATVDPEFPISLRDDPWSIYPDSEWAARAAEWGGA